jgi:long-chain fatty acid transport protein
MRKKMSRSMKGLLIGSTVALTVGGFAVGNAFATYGTNLIGIGPIARGMGGVGVAAPQDAISAVFANPAGMCFGPYCPGSEFNFSGTIFDPHVKGNIRTSGAPSPPGDFDVKAKSQHDPYVIPAIGLSLPINPQWRFGLAAYGVSGLGVDYRNKLQNPFLYPGTPGSYWLDTEYQVMKFAPSIAYLVNDNLSLGAALHIDYANLDFGQGASHGYAAGIQLGALYKTGPMSFGISYVSPQKVTHERVFDFDGNGTRDDFDLESPQNLAVGMAFQPNTRFLIEGNVKWINWGDADGYKDFEWDDQWVFAVGAQYKATPKLALRIGIGYAEQPIDEPGEVPYRPRTVQGYQLAGDQTNFSNFKILGLPAVVETHIGLGIGYDFSDTLSLNASFVHAFENSISETVTNGLGPGADVTFESELYENSFEFGLTKRF